jgi:hypothetical protein
MSNRHQLQKSTVKLAVDPPAKPGKSSEEYQYLNQVKTGYDPKAWMLSRQYQSPNNLSNNKFIPNKLKIRKC